MDIDELVTHALRMDENARAEASEYLKSEPALERVARSPIADNVDIESEAIHVFPDEKNVGYAQIVWDGRVLSAIFLSENVGPVGETRINTNPANEAYLASKDAKWRLGTALIDERTASAQSDDGTVHFAIKDELIAGRLEIEEASAGVAFCRITYRGGNFEGYPHRSYNDIDGPILSYDSIRTKVFGRDARIRSVSAGRIDEAKLFTIAYEGRRLDSARERSLWLLLSFFTGPQLEVVSYEEFNERCERCRLIVPAGTPFTSGGTPPVVTVAAAGDAFAVEFPKVLDKVHADLEKGFPWHVCFRHLHESYTPLLESAVKNLVIALDSLIEATTEDRSKSRFIGKAEYKGLVEPMIETIKKVSSDRNYPDEFLKHMDRVLRTENHPGTAEKRRDFWGNLGIDPDEYDEVLEYRDPAVHSGHVLDYLKPIDYLKFHGQVQRLRTIVNRGFLKSLGYSGPMINSENGTFLDLGTGGAWSP